MALTITTTRVESAMPLAVTDVLGNRRQTAHMVILEGSVSGGAGASIDARQFGLNGIFAMFGDIANPAAITRNSNVLTFPGTNGTYRVLLFGDGAKEVVSNLGTLNG